MELSGGVGLNKQYLSGFTAILIAILIIAPGIAGADSKNRCTVPNVYKNVTAYDAHKILEQRDVFLLDVRTPAEYKYSHIAGAKLIPLKNVPVHDHVNLSDGKLLPNRMKNCQKTKTQKQLFIATPGKEVASQAK